MFSAAPSILPLRRVPTLNASNGGTGKTHNPRLNHVNIPAANPHFHGLRTVIYHAPDLDKAKAWYSSVLGIERYFDQPFYVGCNGGDSELALDADPSSSPGGKAGSVTYWALRTRKLPWTGSFLLVPPSVPVCRTLASVIV